MSRALPICGAVAMLLGALAGSGEIAGLTALTPLVVARTLSGSLPARPDDSRVPAALAALGRERSDPFRWADLAEAYARAGRLPEARRCFETASQFGPRLPEIALRRAAFYAEVGEFSAAVPYLKTVLADDETLARPIFEFYQQHNLPGSAPIDEAIPADHGPAEAWFRYLLEAPSTAADGGLRRTADTWRWLAAHSLTSPPLADQYVRYLFDRTRYPEAQAIWDAQNVSPREAGNLFYNAGFEAEPRDWVFDWKISPCPHAEVALDRAEMHSGRAALRIRFDGLENVSFSHVSQEVLVSPGPHCFSAWAHTDSLTTDQGVGFHIYDPKTPERLDVLVPPVAGSTPWHLVRQCFQVPAGVPRLRIEVVRSLSANLLVRISGSAWFDDFRLEPQSAAPARGTGLP